MSRDVCLKKRTLGSFRTLCPSQYRAGSLVPGYSVSLAAAGASSRSLALGTEGSWLQSLHLEILEYWRILEKQVRNPRALSRFLPPLWGRHTWPWQEPSPVPACRPAPQTGGSEQSGCDAPLPPDPGRTPTALNFCIPSRTRDRNQGQDRRHTSPFTRHPFPWFLVTVALEGLGLGGNLFQKEKDAVLAPLLQNPSWGSCWQAGRQLHPAMPCQPAQPRSRSGSLRPLRCEVLCGGRWQP